MRKLIMVVIATILYSCFSGCAGETSKEFFPLSPGTTWSYKMKNAAYDGLVSAKVESKVRLDSGDGTVLQYERGESSEDPGSELFEKREWGIYAYKRIHPMISHIEATIEPPQPYLKLPPKVGDNWSWEGKIFGMKSTSLFKVESLEVIRSGNKQYRCFKILEKGDSSDGRSFVSSRWYSAGYGLVKEESVMILGKEERETGTMELVNFKAGQN